MLDFVDGTPPEYLRELNEIASELRGEFSRFFDELGRGRSLAYWLTWTASRNTMVSPLFDDFCRLVLVRRILERQPQSRVRLAPDFAAAIRDADGLQIESGRIEIATEGSSSIARRAVRALLRPVGPLLAPLRYLRFCSRFAREHRKRRSAAGVSRGQGRPLSAEPLTIFDTYVTEDVVRKKDFRDVHMPGVLDYLTPEEKRSAVYIFTPYRVADFEQYYRNIRASEANFIIKEDYLRFADYLRALAYPIQIGRIPAKLHFQGIPVDRFLRRNLAADRYNEELATYLLDDRFVRRLRLAGVHVRMLFSWYENQAMDRALNFAFRREYPDAIRIGCQAFIAPGNMLSIRPTAGEAAAGLVPHTVLVSGIEEVDQARDYFPELDVRVGPSFRYAYLHENAEPAPATPITPSKESARTVCVLLSYQNEVSRSILAQVDAVLDNLADVQGLRVLVKAHPNYRSEQAEMVRALGRDALELVDDPLPVLLSRVSLVVGTASGACMESVAWGIPVVVLADLQKLTLNSITDQVPGRLWKMAYNSVELEEGLRWYLDRSAAANREFRSDGERIRVGFFEPVSAAAVRAALRYEPGASLDKSRQIASLKAPGSHRGVV